MTDEVGGWCCANNYEQTLALSLARARPRRPRPSGAFHDHSRGARPARPRGRESCHPAQLAERAARGEPLTRAELGVLLAYAKIVLFSTIVASDVPDDPHFARDLLAISPTRWRRNTPRISPATGCAARSSPASSSNDSSIAAGRPSSPSLQEATGRSPREVVRAFAVVRDGFDLPAALRRLDALDNRIDGQLQLDLYGSVSRLINITAAWDLKNGDETSSLGVQIEALRQARHALRPKIVELAPPAMQERIRARAADLEAAGVKGDLAARLSRLELSELVQDIALVASKAKADIIEAARAYFAVTEAFRIGRIEDAARGLSPSDYYDGLALSRAQDTIAAARRGIAIAALKDNGKALAKTKDGKADDPVSQWLDAGGDRIGRLRDRLQALTEGGDITVSRLSVAAGLMGDLV
jgi:glutamate dehydrogenase